jgi:uncharacterized membrane protein YoaK (UPF0700 family)
MHAMSAIGGQPGVPRRRLVLLLGGTAGYLDAVGYLTLGIFTANMTGNTVLLGIAIGQGRWPAMVRVLVALAAFIAGAGVGALLFRERQRIGRVLGVEAACLLAGLTVGWGGLPESRGAFPLIALLSAAMGAQSAAVRRVGEQRISTTYVTGTLTSLAADTVSQILARRERGRRPVADPAPATRSSLPLLIGIWATYVAGAVIGGFAQYRWGFRSIVLPVIVLAGAAVWDLSRDAAVARPSSRSEDETSARSRSSG